MKAGEKLGLKPNPDPRSRMNRGLRKLALWVRRAKRWIGLKAEAAAGMYFSAGGAAPPLLNAETNLTPEQIKAEGEKAARYLIEQIKAVGEKAARYLIAEVNKILAKNPKGVKELERFLEAAERGIGPIPGGPPTANEDVLRAHHDIKQDLIMADAWLRSHRHEE
jgi:hypothetical protein